MKNVFVIGLIVMAPFLKIFAWQCNGANLEKVSEGKSLWKVTIDNSGEGNKAKDLISNAANEHLNEQQAKIGNRSTSRPWVQPSGEFVFYVTTAYGSDIISSEDFKKGQKMLGSYDNNVFTTTSQVGFGQGTLKFYLNSNLKQYKSNTDGRKIDCNRERGQREGCIVQEYIFTNCK